jgi:hypothetical protein
MRIKTPTLLLASVLKLAGHAAMGVAMGLVFALVLTLTNPSGIMTAIDQCPTPRATFAVFVSTVALTFGIGAALTGFFFMMTEDN